MRAPFSLTAATFTQPSPVCAARSRRCSTSGGHLLAKGFGAPAGTYRDVAKMLAERGVLDQREEELLRLMAGYRNRMTHFYYEISAEALYRICVENLADLTTIRAALLRWVRDNPQRIDHPLTDADA